jgi:hypothetical protein
MPSAAVTAIMNEGADLMTRFAKLLDNVTPDKTSCTGD